jgi:hypothetical protein
MRDTAILRIKFQSNPVVNLRDRIKGMYWGGFRIGWTSKKSEAEKINIDDAVKLAKKLTYLEIEQ